MQVEGGEESSARPAVQPGRVRGGPQDRGVQMKENRQHGCGDLTGISGSNDTSRKYLDIVCVPVT